MSLDLHATHYDDYETNNAVTQDFLRILFNPARAVQVRELNQLQSILQNQVGTLSDRIFVDGTQILGADIKINTKKDYVLVLATAPDTSSVISANWVGSYIRGVTSGTIAKVTGYQGLNLLFDYMTQADIPFISGERIDRIVSLTNPIIDTGTVLNATTSGIPGLATIAIITDGLVYMHGMFVRTNTQDHVVTVPTDANKYFVGYTFDDSIVTSDDDSSLLDNASGTPNYTAPGADRYKIVATLDSYLSTNSKPDEFYEKVVIDNGESYNSSAIKVQYSDILELLARRTHDESGNYSVDPHNVEVTFNQGDPTKLDVTIGSGKTYVQGFEVHKNRPTIIEIDKARITQNISSEISIPSYGVFIDVANNVAWEPESNSSSALPDFITDQETVSLYDAVNGGGTLLATADIISITRSPAGKLRIYFEWNADLSTVLPLAKSMVAADVTFDLDSYNSAAQSDANSKGLVFPLVNQHVDSVATVDYGLISKHNIVSLIDSGPIGSIDANELITEVVAIVDPDLSTVYMQGIHFTVSLGAVGAQATVTFLSSTTITNGFAYLKSEKTGVTADVKVLTNRTVDFDLPASGNYTFATTEYDILRIKTITSFTSDANRTADTNPVVVDLRDVTFDSGHTDTEYKPGSLSGLTDTLYYRVAYQAFSHNGSSDFFTVDSYMSVGNTTIESDLYRLLPAYFSNNGKVALSTRNCIDFRQRGTVDGSALSSRNVLDPNESITVDYNFYLSRMDRIYIDKDGNIDIKTGIPAKEPRLPEEVFETMTIYTLEVPSYTLEPENVIVDEISTSNYTMDDIRTLDKRISNLEYYTSLSLLEKSASDLTITDELGQEKFKNGIFIDNFESHDGGNVDDPEYRCVVNPDNQSCRVPFTMTPVELEGTATANVIEHDHTFTLSYTPVAYIDITSHSDSISVQPYNVFHWEGAMKLTPSSDFWIDTAYLPDIRRMFANGRTIKDRSRFIRGLVSSARNWSGFAPSWRWWRTNWFGTNVQGNDVLSRAVERQTVRDRDDLLASSDLSKSIGITSRPRTITTTTITSTGGTRWRDTTRTTTQRITTNRIGDRVVSREMVPYMRAKQIRYDVTGLIPEFSLKAAFGDVIVTSNCDMIVSIVGDTTTTVTINDGTKFIGAEIDGATVTIPGLGNFTVDAGGYNATAGTITFTATVATGTYDSYGYGSVLKSDSNGRARGYFNLPANTFRVGTTVFELIDPASSITPRTSAESDYTAAGILNTRQRTITSVTNIRTTTASSRIQIRRERNQDPVAQSFFVDKTGGMFLDSIDVYFETKHETIPVEIYIVEMENGVPTRNEIPFSSVWLDPDDVTADVTGATATTFSFSDPVFLQDGQEYAFIVFSNSQDYKIWYAEVGKIDLAPGVGTPVIMKQPYSGVMFTSANQSTWTAHQFRDVKFKMMICDFNTNVNNGRLINLTPIAADIPADISPTKATTISLNVDDMTMYGASINYVTTFGATPVIMENREDNDLTQQYLLSTSNSVTVGATFTTTNRWISPVINKERMSTIFANNDVVFETDHFDAGIYVTDDIHLATPSDDLRVLLDAKLTGTSSVNVYYRTSAFVPKFIEINSLSGTYDNILGVGSDVSGAANVYIQETKGSTTMTAPTSSGTLHVRKIDIIPSPDQINVSDITDGTIFPLVNTKRMIITKDTIANFADYSSGLVPALDDYVVSADIIYKCITATVAGKTPSNNPGYWEVVDAIVVEDSISVLLQTASSSTEWREMRTVTIPKNAAALSDRFVEYEYEPADYAEDDFTSFAVKVEFVATGTSAGQESSAAVNIPEIKNFRAIAVM